MSRDLRAADEDSEFSFTENSEVRNKPDAPLFTR
jgi:hypothetical protein